MENTHQSSDPQLAKFDAWLKSPVVKPPVDLLARVRVRLNESPDLTEEALDTLFQPDPSLRDPRMIEKVRQRLDEVVHDDVPKLVWFKWLTPLAAAATLAFAFISFQFQSPDPLLIESVAQGTAQPERLEVSEDAEITRIFALATNLQGTADMTKLESVENLAFLFD